MEIKSIAHAGKQATQSVLYGPNSNSTGIAVSTETNKPISSLATVIIQYQRGANTWSEISELSHSIKSISGDITRIQTTNGKPPKGLRIWQARLDSGIVVDLHDSTGAADTPEGIRKTIRLKKQKVAIKKNEIARIQTRQNSASGIGASAGIGALIGAAVTIYYNEKRVSNGEITKKEALTDNAVTTTGVHLPAALIAATSMGLVYAKYGSRGGLKVAAFAFVVGTAMGMAAEYGFFEGKEALKDPESWVTNRLADGLGWAFGYTDSRGVKQYGWKRNPHPGLPNYVKNTLRREKILQTK